MASKLIKSRFSIVANNTHINPRMIKLMSVHHDQNAFNKKHYRLRMFIDNSVSGHITRSSTNWHEEYFETRELAFERLYEIEERW
jgi:dihydroxyacetone kinase-like predicted kinase